MCRMPVGIFILIFISSEWLNNEKCSTKNLIKNEEGKCELKTENPLIVRTT